MNEEGSLSSIVLRSVSDPNTVGDILGETNTIAMGVMFTATHKDEFWGYKSSGNRVNYLSDFFFFRFFDGKIVESCVQVDLYNLFKQLKGEK